MLVAALAAYGLLYLLGRHELRAVEARYARREGVLRSEILKCTEEVADLRQDLNALQRKADLTGAATFGPGLRVQALRMIQNGDLPAEIAHRLSVPRNQIELLIKVQRLLADPVSN